MAPAGVARRQSREPYKGIRSADDNVPSQMLSKVTMNSPPLTTKYTAPAIQAAPSTAVTRRAIDSLRASLMAGRT